MKIFVIALAFCCASSAQARLGETLAQITERYGQPTETYRDVKGRLSYIYRYDDYRIMVQYIDGISHNEVYVKLDDSELSDSDMEGLLKANAQGGKWEKYPHPITTSDGSVMRGWVILQSGSLSVYGPSEINDKQYRHALSISTHAYVEQNKALDAR
jgi:hypothetical protein